MATKGDDLYTADELVKDPTKLIEAEARLREAEAATAKEHQLTVWQALRLYPKASAWSLGLSLAVIMDGFDLVLLGSLYAYPAFSRQFGKLASTGDYTISAPWQAGLSNGSSIGQLMGLIFNSWAAEKFGYRRIMILGLFLITCFIFFPFFAKSLPVLLVGEILSGIPWGIFQTLTTAYASEVAPVALRPFLTTWVNACWGIGQLISVGVLRGLLKRTDQWGWRIPFALQWIWPVPLALICFFAPESPWWLVRKGRVEEAKHSLTRLTSRRDVDTFSIDEQVALMVETNRLEKEITAGTSYFDCFKGVNLRRTEVVCGVWAVQQLCGSAFLGITAYFLEQAGLPPSHSFDLSMGQYGINTGGVVIAWAFMTWGIGRRTLYLYGTCAMFCMLILIGGVSLINTTASAWATGALLLLWSVCYQTTVGTVAYSLVAELSSRRLLIKTINIGRGLYAIIGIVNSTFNPYMLNPTAWNWKGKTGFFWAGICLFCIVWIYFRLPEPKGLTFAEIDQLFEMRVPARQFRKVGVKTFANEKERVERAKEALDPNVLHHEEKEKSQLR